MKLCDVFVLLTRYPNEGQPISILEAMGNGMVVITTDHAGIPDIVEDGVNGFLCRSKDENIVVEANAILNHVSCEKIGRNGRERVVEQYLQSRYIANMKQVFALCIDYDLKFK